MSFASPPERVRTQAGPLPGSAAAWLLACRPKTLAAALVPVAVGTACAIAAGGFRAGPALAALLGALLLQVGANLANDVFDFEKGADNELRLGPTRAVQAGLLTPSRARCGMALAFALAMVAGAWLTSVAGPIVVAIGLASIACAVAYTGGPYPLGYHGLGEVFVMLFFGFVAVCGTAFVQVGAVPEAAWLASVPVGALATAILAVNNLRDRQTDALAKKRTLAVRFGERGAIAEYALLVSLAYLVPAAMVALHLASPWALLPLLTLPLAVSRVRRIVRVRGRVRGRALNGELEATARLLLFHGLLFAAGLAVG